MTIVTWKRHGFKSLGEYREHLAKKKGFKSYYEYEIYLAKEKIFERNKNMII